jgi:hypothetical protein
MASCKENRQLKSDPAQPAPKSTFTTLRIMDEFDLDEVAVGVWRGGVSLPGAVPDGG